MTWRRPIIWALTAIGWIVCAPFILLAMVLESALEHLTEADERERRS